MINTVIHESGHALMALLGGDIHEISLFVNTEGVTYTSHSSWFGGFFTSLAGYIFSSAMAFLGFWLLAKGKNKVYIGILLGFIGLNLIFWVRNFYGIFWLITFGISFILLLIKSKKVVVETVILSLASIILVESVTSAFDIMALSFMHPQAAGDATNLAKSTVIIPVQVWGVFFFVQSIWWGVLSYRMGL
ncbi:hypothetical protein GCM10008967_27520 [Bacillus carboniphilus]|uniref:M50 family peptidase n=2 Tax=Bacillus carboniphilus TaxID=86663 RepID=A0ABN0WFM7_9BACI